MSPTSEFMAEVSLTHSYPELFQVTGLYRRSYFGPRTCGGGITKVIEVSGVLNQGFKGAARRLMMMSFICSCRNKI